MSNLYRFHSVTTLFKMSSDQEYIPERIINKMMTTDGKVMFFVKWKGLPDSENSWKPLEELDCPQLIVAYYEDQEDKLLDRKEKVMEYFYEKKRISDTNYKSVKSGLLIDRRRLALNKLLRYGKCYKFTPVFSKKSDI